MIPGIRCPSSLPRDVMCFAGCIYIIYLKVSVHPKAFCTVRARVYVMCAALCGGTPHSACCSGFPPSLPPSLLSLQGCVVPSVGGCVPPSGLPPAILYGHFVNMYSGATDSAFAATLLGMNAIVTWIKVNTCTSLTCFSPAHEDYAGPSAVKAILTVSDLLAKHAVYRMLDVVTVLDTWWQFLKYLNTFPHLAMMTITMANALAPTVSEQPFSCIGPKEPALDWVGLHWTALGCIGLHSLSL